MNADHIARTLCTIDLTVHIKAPWLVHGNDPGQLGLDAVHLRNREGLRVLPGTLLVGRIRDAWHEINALTPGLMPKPTDWFGPTSDKQPEESTPGQRTRIFADDLVECHMSDSSTPVAGLSTRVVINDATGAADEGMLQFIEQDDAPGAACALQGQWHAWLSTDEQQSLTKHLAQGLRWHSQLGALRNIGFGELTSATVQIRPANAAQNQVTTAIENNTNDAGPRGLKMTFTQPLAVNNKLINGNIFESGDTITGATIKGALATALQRSGKAIPAWFDALRITHALPSSNDQRPSPLPLNWCADTDGNLYAHEIAGPALRNGQALAFQPDWKDAVWTAANQKRAWGETTTQLRVRTAIKEGMAKDKSLFAYQCKQALIENNEISTTWIATLDHRQATPEMWQDLSTLLAQGLIGPIGKTDAFGKVELLPQVTHQWPCQAVTDNAFTLLLHSDALLCAVKQVVGLQGLDSGDPKTLHEVLTANWCDMANQTQPGAGTGLTLEWFFAQHQFAGGHYLHKRFPPKDKTANPYAPYILTQAGSVFRLRFADAPTAQAVAHAWQKHGLLLPKTVKEQYGDTWERNPYIPENGWGEVRINPAHGVKASTESTRNNAGA